MSAKYIFIPLSQESALAAINDQYLSEEGAWLICQGVYKAGAFQEGETLIYSVNREGQTTNIMKSSYNFMTNESLAVVGFMVEGADGDLETEIMGLTDVQAFETAEEYLDYIENYEL